MTTKKTSPDRKRPAKSKKSTAGRIRERELAERRDYLLKESIVMLTADLNGTAYLLPLLPAAGRRHLTGADDIAGG